MNAKPLTPEEIGTKLALEYCYPDDIEVVGWFGKAADDLPGPRQLKKRTLQG